MQEKNLFPGQFQWISLKCMTSQMGFQENPDIDIGKRKSSSKIVNLLKRMDRYKEDILKFLFANDVPFDNNLAKKTFKDAHS